MIIGAFLFANYLRTCSISPQQERQKSQIDKLQAGVEQALGIFPKPAALLQPSE